MAASNDAQTFHNVSRKRLLVRLIIDAVTAPPPSSRIRSRNAPFEFSTDLNLNGSLGGHADE